MCHHLSPLRQWLHPYRRGGPAAAAYPGWATPVRGLWRGTTRSWGICHPERADACVSSPPYADQQSWHWQGGPYRLARLYRITGDGTIAVPGQLAAMPTGDGGRSVAATSPCASGGKPHATTGGGPCSERDHTVGSVDDRLALRRAISALTPGDIQGVIASPPYADRCASDNQRHLMAAAAGTGCAKAQRGGWTYRNQEHRSGLTVRI